MTGGSVQITDTATPELLRIRSQVQRPRALMAAAGKRVEKELRQHFSEKDAQGNRRGWVRSHFWNRRVRQATAFTGATDTSAEVRIASPEFIHKLKGGTVRAKRGRMLTIPLTNRAKAAGSPREYDGEGNVTSQQILFPLKTNRGLFLMVRKFQKRGRGKGRGAIYGQRLLAAYKLVPKVTHAPDPTALPPAGYLEAAIDDEALKFLRRTSPL